jgi:hypothetical protein
MCDSDEIWECTKREEKRTICFHWKHSYRKKNLVWLPIEKVTYPLNKAPPAVLQKYFSHPSLVSYLFRNFTNKTETGTQQNKWGGGELLVNTKTTWTNHYDRPIRNTEHQSDPIYYTLFFCTSHPGHCCVIDQLACAHSVQLRLSENGFSWSKPSYFGDFSSSNNSYCAGSHTEHHWSWETSW